MALLKSDAIFNGLSLVARFDQKWRMERAQRQPFEPHQLDFVLDTLRAMQLALDEAGLQISAKHAAGLIDALAGAPIDPDSGDKVVEGRNRSLAEHHLDRLVAVVSEEAETKTFVSIPSRHAERYQQSAGLFGNAVDDKFPDAIGDISEAGKCLALDRPTAAIFHLMRAMESAVAELGNAIGATIAEAGSGETMPWGKIVANIKPKIDAMPKGPKKDEWYEVHALMHSVNRAFRTKTAHPGRIYTPEEAESAFGACKAFMQHLAKIV